MTLGLSLEAFTRLHVALSLVIAQLVALALFSVLTVLAARRFRG